MPKAVTVAELRQTDLLLLAAFQARIAAAIREETTVAGTPAFQQITEALRLCGQRLERLADVEPAAAEPQPEPAAKAAGAGDPLMGLKLIG